MKINKTAGIDSISAELLEADITHGGQSSNGYKRSCAGYKRDLALDTNVPYGILL
jgi:hypothetical protein